ncbi:hypothetical protein AeMF1_006374, partial [Aphanomyces euteiches]
MTIEQKQTVLKDAAAGLLNIHEGRFIHRDMAARNLLIDGNLQAKICDFGMCRRVDSYGGSHFESGVGPLKYMGPESLSPPHSFSYRSDAYSFGVLMWETFTEVTPYKGLRGDEAATLNGLSPLHHATKDGHTDVVHALLSNDMIDVNAKDNRDGSPLHTAATHGRLDIVNLILGHGAINVSAKQKYIGSAFDIAASKGHIEILQLLLRYGRSDSLFLSENFGEMLKRASMNGHLNIVQLLLRDFATTIDLHPTALAIALHDATKNGHIDIIATATESHRY